MKRQKCFCESFSAMPSYNFYRILRMCVVHVRALPIWPLLRSGETKGNLCPPNTAVFCCQLEFWVLTMRYEVLKQEGRALGCHICRGMQRSLFALLIVSGSNQAVHIFSLQTSNSRTFIFFSPSCSLPSFFLPDAFYYQFTFSKSSVWNTSQWILQPLFSFKIGRLSTSCLRLPSGLPILTCYSGCDNSTCFFKFSCTSARPCYSPGKISMTLFQIAVWNFIKN